MSPISKKNSVHSTTKSSSQQKQQLGVPRSFITKNGTLRITGLGRDTSVSTRVRRSLNPDEMLPEKDESDEAIVLIEEDQDPNVIDEDDQDDQEEQQEEPMNDEGVEDIVLPPSSTTTPKQTGQQQINVTRTPIARTPEQRMRDAMRKLKDVNLHLRKMEELSTEETKTMDAEWKEFQIIHGIPKSESQVKYTSPNIIMLDESEKSRGFGGRWWFGINSKTNEKIERLTIQQYATRLQPISFGYGGNNNAKKISLSKAEFAQLLNKLPDIMDEYVKSAEAFNYLYDKAAQERMKREAITGIDNSKCDGNGNSGQYYGPSAWSRQINQSK
uniref:Uncharacterized protein n=1 Tax=Plectus sambesii TaxID=2011161 RepID=A0A914URR9_9BILA